MSSTAISAQGTIIQIATGTGTAKTVTGVGTGNPTVLTSSAHGFGNGDVITFNSGFTGTDAASLNGKTYSVQFKTTNTYAVGEDTTGKTITAGTGAATPATYTAIGNIRGYDNLGGGERSEIDVTNFDSLAKEKRLGLQDNGTFTADIDIDDGNAGQVACRTNQGSISPVGFKVILPTGTTPTRSFLGLVKGFTESGAVDNVVKGRLTVTVSGAITHS